MEEAKATPVPGRLLNSGVEPWIRDFKKSEERPIDSIKPMSLPNFIHRPESHTSILIEHTSKHSLRCPQLVCRTGDDALQLGVFPPKLLSSLSEFRLLVLQSRKLFGKFSSACTSVSDFGLERRKLRFRFVLCRTMGVQVRLGCFQSLSLRQLILFHGFNFALEIFISFRSRAELARPTTFGVER